MVFGSSRLKKNQTNSSVFKWKSVRDVETTAEAASKVAETCQQPGVSQ